MRNAMKPILKYITVFLLAIVLMVSVLVGVAVIPRQRIQNKAEESAELLMLRDVNFYNLNGGHEGRIVIRTGDCSKIDQVADSISLSMAYYLEADHPLESVLWAKYYDGRKETGSYIYTMNESYQKTVKENVPANMQYLRYWHGSLVLIKPMLMFWNIRQMKIYHGVVIAVLLLMLLILLIKKGLKAEAVSMGIAMIAISIWFVPLSLEYTWMFLLMLIVSIVAVKLALSKRITSLNMLFFVTGICAAYFDFLTTETVTLLVPLLLAIRIMKDDMGEKKKWVFSGKSIVLWGIGFIRTWAAKWIISAIVFDQDVIQYIQDNVLLHLGTTDDIPAIRQIYEGLLRNIAPLFPFGYGMAGAAVFLVMLFIFVLIPVYRGQISLKKKVNWERILLYLLLGLIVYVRFIVLRHHVWRHYFFTYRAQAATILALCFIILELVEPVPTHRKAVKTHGSDNPHAVSE